MSILERVFERVTTGESAHLAVRLLDVSSNMTALMRDSIFEEPSSAVIPAAIIIPMYLEKMQETALEADNEQIKEVRLTISTIISTAFMESIKDNPLLLSGECVEKIIGEIQAVKDKYVRMAEEAGMGEKVVH